MTTTAPVAGWYPDPLDSSAHRYWDGTGWTEHTTPAQGTAEPAPQPARAQVHVPAPVETPRPQTGYSGPTTPAPFPSSQGSFPSNDPWAVRRDVARPGPARALSPYSRRPPGMSTATKVLIGVAIAFGSLVVLGILAAIAIPVFLNQRAIGKEAARSPSTSAPITAVVMPDRAAGLVRAPSAQSRQLTQQWMTLPIAGAKSVAVYDDAAGRPRSAVMLTRVDMSAADQAEFLRGAKSGTAGRGLTAFRTVSPGTLGGTVQCASLPSSNVTICLFADSKVGGAIDIFGTTSGDALALQLRGAVEHGL